MRWLTAFLLPHLVIPSDPFLIAILTAGSVLFVLGITGFLLCVLQVYAGRLWKTGAALLPLARDKERRVLARCGEDYRGYMDRTGMFLPRPSDRLLLRGAQRLGKPHAARLAAMHAPSRTSKVGEPGFTSGFLGWRRPRDER